MAKEKVNQEEIENLFVELDDDPRSAHTTPIEDTINVDVKKLFTVVGASTEKSEKLDATPYSFWRLAFRQLFKNPLVIVCIVILAVLIFFAIFGTSIHYYEPFTKTALGEITPIKYDFATEASGYIKDPDATNWLGVCPSFMGSYFEGQDMWSVIWKGTQLSLLLGVVVALIDTILGIIIGSLWGYIRWLDPILIEFRNFVNNIPTLLLDILLMTFFQPYMKQYAFFIVVFLLCVFGWLGLAGFIRNQIIIIRNREYNIASQTLGSSNKSMITHNLLPYLVSVIVTVVSTAIPEAISSEVGLAYFNLSFKVSNGDITLGQILTKAVSGLTWMSHPYLLIAPLIVMAPLTVCFFYMGLALSDATDPKSHR